jgi:hypothetical protein
MSLQQFIFPCALSVLLITACHERGTPSGGPCSYKINVSPAKIIRVTPVDSTHSQVEFSVVKDNGPDTIAYSEYFHAYASADEIRKYELVPGNEMIFQQHEIVKGTCNPYYYSLKLKKYKKD